MRVLSNALENKSEPLLKEVNEAHGCGPQYKASKRGFAEFSDIEGAAVIVLARHDGSSIS